MAINARTEEAWQSIHSLHSDAATDRTWLHRIPKVQTARVPIHPAASMNHTVTIRLPKDLIDLLHQRKDTTGVPIQKIVAFALIKHFRVPSRSAASGGTKRLNTAAASVPACANHANPSTL